MNVDQEDYHYRLKVVVLGDSKCGKTTFLDTMTQNNGKVIEIESSEEISERVSLQMIEHLLFKITYWELPGRDRNIKYIHHYAMGAAAVIVMFDTTKSSSFERAQSILENIEVCNIPIKILIGNKVDLLTTKKNITPVIQQDAELLAKNFGCEYFPCNSLLEVSTNEIFTTLMKLITNVIGENMDLQNLVGKNISVGKRVFVHPTFQKNLKENSYFKD